MKKLIIWAVVIGTAAYFGSKMLLHHKVESGVDSAILALSPFATVSYDGVSSTLSGELTIDGIRATINGFDDEITIDRLGIDTPSFLSLLSIVDIAENIHSPDDVIPEYFGFIVDGVHSKVEADYLKKLYDMRVQLLGAADAGEAAVECTGRYGYSPQALADLGYSEQVISLSAHFRRGHGNYVIDIATSTKDMWDFDAELTLAGDMVGEFSKGMRYRPRLSSMRLEYTDRSLNERVRKYCGRLGLSREETVQAQLDSLRFFGEENGIEFDEYVIEPYTEFLNGKSRLVITANPSEPISISQIDLYKPSDVPALLDLTAEVY